MAYATVDDMVLAFGSTEMVRLTTPADQEMDGIVRDVADAALVSASALIDSYLGKRYRVPMDLPTPAVTDACCDLARYRLSTGDGKSCSEDVRARNNDATRWLRDVSSGAVVLDLDEVATGDESFAQMSERECAPFGRGAF